jgi:hypothetical protein
MRAIRAESFVIELVAEMLARFGIARIVKQAIERIRQGRDGEAK